MNTILVINGSPKGKNSITLHTCLFLEKKFPGYKFDYLDAGQRIKVLEKDFSPALEAIREADLLVFCYPVYTFLVPSQLHRFMELMNGLGWRGYCCLGRWKRPNRNLNYSNISRVLAFRASPSPSL